MKKKLDESNQFFKSYENYIGDDKIKIEVSKKVFENKITEKINSHKKEIYKKKSRLTGLLKFQIVINVNCYQIIKYCGNKYY